MTHGCAAKRNEKIEKSFEKTEVYVEKLFNADCEEKYYRKKNAARADQGRRSGSRASVTNVDGCEEIL